MNNKRILYLPMWILAVLIASCNGNHPAQEQTQQAVSKAVDQSNRQETVVFINTDSLLTQYEYCKKLKARFQEKSKKLEAELNARGASFQKEVTDYQNSASSLSAEQRTATEQRLTRKQQELVAYNQNTSSTLANEEAAENEKLHARVANYLKKYAREKGYKMVLAYSKLNPVLLFADVSLEVTKEVIQGLNETYQRD